MQAYFETIGTVVFVHHTSHRVSAGEQVSLPLNASKLSPSLQKPQKRPLAAPAHPVHPAYSLGDEIITMMISFTSRLDHVVLPNFLFQSAVFKVHVGESTRLCHVCLGLGSGSLNRCAF